MKVFLGGTCNESSWRANLIEKLDIDYFNPVVEDWTEECMAEEIRQRGSCDFVLYTITPKLTGVYSIAEVIDDSNKRPDKTILCVLCKDGGHSFSTGMLKSITQVVNMARENGVKTFTNLDSVAKYLNLQNKDHKVSRSEVFEILKLYIDNSGDTVSTDTLIDLICDMECGCTYSEIVDHYNL